MLEENLDVASRVGSLNCRITCFCTICMVATLGRGGGCKLLQYARLCVKETDAEAKGEMEGV